MTADQVIAYVKGKLHDGPCPGKGALGELCYLNSDPAPTSDGTTMHDTHMAVWADALTATQVADWFKEAGATQVFICAWLHCEDNDMRDGRSTLDNTQAWDIVFWLPGSSAPAGQSLTPKVTP